MCMICTFLQFIHSANSMKKILPTLLLSSGIATAAISGQIVLSTSFTAPSNDSFLFANANDSAQNGSKTVAVTLNDIAYGSGWGSVGANVLSLDMGGGYSWSRATVGFGNRMFTTLGDGSWQALNSASAAVNSNRIAVTAGDAILAMSSGQVGLSTNPSPLNVGIFNLVFSVDNTFNAPGLAISFRAGGNVFTGGATAGTFGDQTEEQNGFWQARIVPVNMVGTDGTMDYTGAISFGAVASIPAGAGPTVSGSVMQSLGEGTYVLQILLSDKTLNQRFGIDDLVVTAIPEPSTYAALFGLLVLGVTFWRRRR